MLPYRVLIVIGSYAEALIVELSQTLQCMLMDRNMCCLCFVYLDKALPKTS